MKQHLFNIDLVVEGISDFTEKCYHRGKLFLVREAGKALFEAESPRRRYARNRKVYQDLGVRVMRCPDGSFVMTVAFEWQGTNTWNALMQIVRNVYQALKSL